MKIAFMGLGKMGRPMALNMLKSDADIIIYARNADALSEFEGRGAKVTTNLLDTADADMIFMCLPNTEVVQDLLVGSNGIINKLREGQIIVDLSTIKYKSTIEIAEALAKKGVHFIDAPVSGMESRAIEGTLTIMCGGDVEVFYKVRSYLEFLGSKILYMGSVGSGQLSKLVNQLLYDINIAAVSEILPFAIKMGLDPEKIGQVVNSGTGRSHASEYFIPHMLKGEFQTSYSLNNAYKDLVSAGEIGVNLCIPMPITAAATYTYQSAMLRGYGDSDKSGMIHVYEELLGVKFRS